MRRLTKAEWRDALQEVPVEVMADMLGVTPRTLYERGRQGRLQKTAGGKFNAFSTLAADRERQPRGETPLGAARLSHKREHARELRLRNEAREAVLIPADGLADVLAEFIGINAQGIDELQRRLTALAPSPALRQRVREECDSIRQALADAIQASRLAANGTGTD